MLPVVRKLGRENYTASLIPSFCILPGKHTKPQFRAVSCSERSPRWTLPCTRSSRRPLPATLSKYMDQGSGLQCLAGVFLAQLFRGYGAQVPSFNKIETLFDRARRTNAAAMA